MNNKQITGLGLGSILIIPGQDTGMVRECHQEGVKQHCKVQDIGL